MGINESQRYLLPEEGFGRRENVDVYHPQAVEQWLSVLRNKDTRIQEFRRNADNISFALGLRLAEILPTFTKGIMTPVGETEARLIDSEHTLLVAVLRSGYPMCEGIKKAMHDVKIALLDIKRDEETAEPRLNYDGLPPSLYSFNRVFVPDPMLATGGTAAMTIDMLRRRGASGIHLVSIVSAPGGLARITKNYPEVSITTCAVDAGLNARKYIVPGLGDFGDRYFGDAPFTIPDLDRNQLLTFQNDGRFTTKPLLEVN